MIFKFKEDIWFVDRKLWVISMLYEDCILGGESEGRDLGGGRRELNSEVWGLLFF